MGGYLLESITCTPKKKKKKNERERKRDRQTDRQTENRERHRLTHRKEQASSQTLNRESLTGRQAETVRDTQSQRQIDRERKKDSTSSVAHIITLAVLYELTGHFVR